MPKIIQKKGIIAKKITELQNEKIEGIHINQSIIGTILGYGTITINGTGGMKNDFKNISNPIDIKNIISNHLDSQQ